MEAFILQLLHDKGLPADLDEGVQAQLVKDLTNRLVDMINRRVIDTLSEEQAQELEKLIDQNPDNPQAIQEFIDKNVPDKQEIATKAMFEFRTLYLGANA